jgi:hypothetical protein
MKLQIPNLKLQKSTKSQTSNTLSDSVFGYLDFGVLLGFGIWILGFLWSADLGAWIL